MKDFKDLRVWTKAHELTLDVYRLSRSFPADERFGLTSQIRRAASSIGANLAEGCGRRSDGEFHRFLQIARGSASELEYHLLLSRDLGILSKDDFDGLQLQVLEVERMLTSLVQSVRPPAKREGNEGEKTMQTLHRKELVTRSE
jgi:four helix bundle protein